jgi:hypothetical protein
MGREVKYLLESYYLLNLESILEMVSAMPSIPASEVLYKLENIKRLKTWTK